MSLDINFFKDFLNFFVNMRYNICFLGVQLLSILDI
jgi:hypothetical protein